MLPRGEMSRLKRRTGDLVAQNNRLFVFHHIFFGDDPFGRITGARRRDREIVRFLNDAGQSDDGRIGKKRKGAHKRGKLVVVPNEVKLPQQLLMACSVGGERHPFVLMGAAERVGDR